MAIVAGGQTRGLPLAPGDHLNVLLASRRVVVGAARAQCTNDTYVCAGAGLLIIFLGRLSQEVVLIFRARGAARASARPAACAETKV